MLKPETQNFELPDDFKVSWFALHDHDEAIRRKLGAFQIEPEDAWKFNSDGFGVFWTVNEFKGQRVMTNLAKIRSWAIEMDDGSKPEMLDRIKSSPAVPSLVVETRRGYHVYFFAYEANAAFWNAIVLDRLVPFFKADKRARDLCRILRVPGYLHQKDPKDPFQVRAVHFRDIRYTTEQMAWLFKDLNAPAKKAFEKETGELIGKPGSFWDNLFHADHEDLLTKISGSKHVRGETFSFTKNSNGKKNILVDGNSTSTFIDKEGRIGSLDGGGPTLYHWLTWYGHSPREAFSIIETEFPWLKSNN